MRTILIIVDTLRYDEGQRIREMVGRPCRSFRRHYGVAPYTLPAMASMMTGLLPTEHNLWRYHDEPLKARLQSRIRRTIGHQVDAVAVGCGGFADGEFWGFGAGFRRWRTLHVESYEFAGAVEGHAALEVLHTYEVHNYVLERDLNARMPVRASEIRSVRWPRVESVAGRVQRLLDAWPKHRVVVTSDHGEALQPTKWGQGHGAQLPPVTGLIHLPFLVYGPDVDQDEDIREVLPQTQLLEWLLDRWRGCRPVVVSWPWNRQGESWLRRYEIGQAGVRILEGPGARAA